MKSGSAANTSPKGQDQIFQETHACNVVTEMKKGSATNTRLKGQDQNLQASPFALCCKRNEERELQQTRAPKAKTKSFMKTRYWNVVTEIKQENCNKHEP